MASERVPFMPSKSDSPPPCERVPKEAEEEGGGGRRQAAGGGVDGACACEEGKAENEGGSLEAAEHAS